MCMNFNFLFIIDCWDDAWIRDFGARNMRQFYGRMLDHLDAYEFDHVILCTDSSHSVHPWFLSQWRHSVVCHTLQDVNVFKPHRGQTSLCAGTSWSHCVHNSNLGLRNQMKLNLQAHSAPELVRGPARGEYTVTHRDFMTDPVIDWQPVRETSVWRAARLRSI